MLIFASFLQLILTVREELARGHHEELQKLFRKYDKDASGELNMREISRLLEHFGCLPSTVEEQREILQMIDEADEDGSGLINFLEFKSLILKILRT